MWKEMDEFSEFQMAVHKPTPNGVNVGLPFKNGVSHGGKLGNLKFPDTSPVHSLSSHHTSTNNTISKADFVRSQQISSIIPPPVPPPVQKCGVNVGSRLANYDLGLSVPATTTTTNGFQGGGSVCNNLGNIVGLSSKTINNPSRNNNQDLLIGEEDKYSALRMLIETDMDSTTSIFENPGTVPDQQVNNVQSYANLSSTTSPSNATVTPPPPLSVPPLKNINNSNLIFEDVNHSSSHMNTKLMSALQISTTSEQDSFVATTSQDSSSDFGDFQSFTGFTEGGNQINGLQSQTQIPPSNSSKLGLNGFFSNFQTSSNPQDQYQRSTLPSLQKQDDALRESKAYENGCDDSDGEFGDFVSVEPIHAVVPPLTLSAPKQVPVTTGNDSNFDLSLLPQPVTSPHKQVLKHVHDETEANANDLPSTTSKGVYELNLSPNINSPQKQKFSEDDINNIVLGQGLDWESSSVGMDAIKSANSQQTPSFFPSLTPSSFIRTSLIRNDEVTDIDPTKWNQSVNEEVNNDGVVEFSSFERKDYSSTNGKSKFLDVSPETRSIASLDLGSYVTVDYPENGNGANNGQNNNNNNNASKMFDQSIILQSNHQNYTKTGGRSASPPVTALMASEEAVFDENDKYQCFRDESENEKERYCAEWARCLEACKAMISHAFSVFNSVSTSEIIRELVSDEKGYSYVINIFEIYKISSRIQKSAEKVGVESKVKDVCLETKNLWETLSAFLLGTSVSSEICSDITEEGCSTDLNEPLPSCGVCLCDVDTSQSNEFLDYGGKIYHCKCANFWVNEVDAILPSLTCVSNVNTNKQQHQQPISKFDKNNIL